MSPPSGSTQRLFLGLPRKSKCLATVTVASIALLSLAASLNAGTPRIAATSYSDYDTPVVTVDAVTDFGADNTGTTDASVKIQNALNAAAADHAGVVFLPQGRYLLKRTLTVPDSVTLRGDWKRPTASDKTVAGTILLIDHGEGTTGISYRSPDNVPTDLAGNSLGINTGASVGFILNLESGLRDLTIYYPKQTLANPSSPLLYPYTIDAVGGFAITRNVTLVNSYEGIFTASSLPTAVSVYGSPIRRGLFTNKTASTPRFENMQFQPEFWSQSGLGSVTTENIITAMRAVDGIGIQVGWGGGGAVYLGIKISGYDVAMKTFDGQSPRMFDFEITRCRIGLDFPDSKGHGWVISKGLIDAEELCALVYHESNNVSFNNVSFKSGGRIIEHRSGALLFTQCTFQDWGSDYAIVAYSDPADLTSPAPFLCVSGCGFLKAGQHIKLDAGVGRAVIYGNTPTGSAFNVLNNAGSGAYFVIDKSSTHDFIRMDPVDSVEDLLKVHKQVPKPPAGTSHVFNVRGYGARGTGYVDDTTAFQNALAAAGAVASSSAGSVVYIPAGVYRINGRLSVPSHVELRGCHDGGVTGEEAVAIVCLFADKGLPNNPASIQLAPDSGIRGFALIRPEQGWNCSATDEAEVAAYIAANRIPYPPAIKGTNRNWAYDLCLANTYDGIDFSAGGGHHLEFIYGSTVNKMIILGGAGQRSQAINVQAKSDAWRQCSKDNDYFYAVNPEFAETAPYNLGRANGLGEMGTGIVFEGNGEFLTLGDFINGSGEGLFIVNGSPKLNMYISGGEGSGTGIIINSVDAAALDMEVVGNSYHCFHQYTISDTSADDRLHLINCKHYGSSNTSHIFRGDGLLVSQSDYRGGFGHEIDLQLEDNTTAIVESGYADGKASLAAIRTLDGSRAKICGRLSASSKWFFLSEDAGEIERVSLCPNNFQYTTAPTPPSATGFSPADDSVNVAVLANLTVTFNENIAAGNGLITIKNLTDNTQSTIDITDGTQVSISGTTLAINPTNDLLNSKAYAIRIAAGTVEDTSGTDFPGITDDMTWNFTTADPSDFTPPSISTLNPADNATGVSASANLVATFNEPVQAGTGNIVLKKSSDNSTVQTFDVTTDVVFSGTQITMNPTSDLNFSTQYYVEIASGAVEDLSGNGFAGLSGSGAWNLTTGAGGIAVTNIGASTVFNGITSAGTVSGDKGGRISNWALNGGNAVVFLISQEESGNGWTGFTASYGSEAMTVVETIGPAGSRWNSAIAYIINPVASTANLTFGWTSVATSSEGVFTPLSLSNVGSVLGSTSRDATSGATLTLNYTSTQDGGFVVGVGNNNEFQNGAAGAPASDGDLDTNLFRNIASGNTGVLHVYGDIPTAGSSSSSLGDLLGASSGPNHSSAIVAFEAALVADTGYDSWIGGFDVGVQTDLADDPDGDGIPNGIEAWFGTHPDEFSPGVFDIGDNGTQIFFSHPRSANPPSDLSIFYEWSLNLVDWYACDDVDGPLSGETVSVSSDTVGATTTVTATASGPMDCLFLRAGVRQNFE